MIARIVPQFFTVDIDASLRYYRDRLGFATQFTHGEPPFYAGAIRDDQSIFFRRVDCPLPQSADKFAEEYLDAYLRVEGIVELFAEYQANGVVFTRPLGQMPWDFTEFVVRDCDDRLLCFGQATADVTKA